MFLFFYHLLTAIITSSSGVSSQTNNYSGDIYFVPGRRSIFFNDIIRYFHTFPTLEVMQRPPKPLEHPYVPKSFIQYSMLPVLLGIIPEDWVLDRIHNEKEDEIMRKQKLREEQQV
jgi:hypothetical protein